MKSGIFLLLASLLLSISCRNTTDNDKIDVSFNNSISSFAALIGRIELIPLATDSEHILGDNPELIASDTSLYLVDLMNSKIYRYSHSGSFLNAVGRRGNGNGEYNSINGVQVDGNILTVHSYPNKILKYAIDGEFIGQKLRTDLGQFSYSFAEDTILTYYGYGSTTPYRAALIGASRVLDEFLLDEDTDKVLNYRSLASPISNCKNRIFLIDSFNPIVYAYSNAELVPYLQFDFGKYSVPRKYYTYSDVFEAAEYLMSIDYAIINRYVECGSVKMVEILLNKADSGYPYYGLYYNDEWHWFSFGNWDSSMSLAFRCFSEANDLLFVLSPTAVHNLPEALRHLVVNYDISKSVSEEDNYIIAKVSLK